MAGFHWSGSTPDAESKSSEMKWLSGGLTFVNFATISGLLIGMLTGGLSTPVAFSALILAAAFALFAYPRTSDPKSEADALDRDTSKASKYRNLPSWLLASFLPIFAGSYSVR